MIYEILILMLGIGILVAPMVMADALDPRNRRHYLEKWLKRPQ